MTKKPDDTRISKTMSHALRHEPASYGLELAADGSVLITELVRGLRGAGLDVGEHDIERVVEQSPKQRFVIDGNWVCAQYGHSTDDRIEKDPIVPRAVLWHATSPAVAEEILRGGLKPMARQYVHLTVEPELALEAGRRKARHPVLLKIDAAAAHAAGVTFYEGHERVTLADTVPADFIKLVDSTEG